MRKLILVLLIFICGCARIQNSPGAQAALIIGSGAVVTAAMSSKYAIEYNDYDARIVTGVAATSAIAAFGVAGIIAALQYED